MNLQLKHLAPYLPYKLKIKYWDRKPVMNGGQGSSNHWIGITATLQRFDKENCLPILRPLSDLTKKIEINEVRFIPTQELSRINPDPNTDPVVMSSGEINYDPYHEYCKLLEWHFDLFNLIDNGLAIDINTIK